MGTRCACIAAVLVGAILAVATSSSGASERASRAMRFQCPLSSMTPGDAPAVDRVLRAGTHVCGNALLRRRDGPIYEAARRYLSPVLFARGARGAKLTASELVYVPFGEPSGADGLRSREERISQVTLGGHALPFDPTTQTVDLTVLADRVDLIARVVPR